MEIESVCVWEGGDNILMTCHSAISYELIAFTMQSMGASENTFNWQMYEFGPF